MKYEALLLLQFVGIFMAFIEFEELVNCSRWKLTGRLFVIMTPTLLYINLQFLPPAVF
jgi:hypothetical protein